MPSSSSNDQEPRKNKVQKTATTKKPSVDLNNILNVIGQFLGSSPSLSHSYSAVSSSSSYNSSINGITKKKKKKQQNKVKKNLSQIPEKEQCQNEDCSSVKPDSNEANKILDSSHTNSFQSNRNIAQNAKLSKEDKDKMEIISEILHPKLVV